MKNLKKALILIILAVLFAAAIVFIDKQLIINSKENIITIANNNLILAAIVYTTIYAICVALSLPIATALTLLAGIIFKPILGTFIVVIGASIGSSFIFLAVKNASDKINLTNKFNNSKHLLTLQKNLRNNAASYLLFARLVPLFPFVLVNIAPATVGIKLSTFMWTTFIGIIPGSFIYTYVGYQSGQISNVQSLISKEMLLALTLLGVFSLAPILIKRIKSNG